MTNIWEDPLYLHDLALSLLGAVGSRPLTEGFRTRDDKMFQQGVESLRRTTESVKGMGLAMTLGGYICFPEPEFRTVNSCKKGILIQPFLYQLL